MVSWKCPRGVLGVFQRYVPEVSQRCLRGVPEVCSIIKTDFFKPQVEHF